MTAALVLASASPRRAQILAEMRIPFVVDPSSVDETLLSGEPADAAAKRLARAKAEEVARRRPEAWVLAADTLVVLDRDILGKPQNDAEAARMLRRLSDRDHRVVTGVCFRKGDEELSEIAWSFVTFSPLSDEEIAWYVATGEPRDKAGAYGVQGLGARFVIGIEGSYTNVMGLPAAVVYRLMKASRDSALGALVLSSP